MKRRRFVKDASRFGVTFGIAGTAADRLAAALALAETPASAGYAHVPASQSLAAFPGTPMLVLDGEWSIAVDPYNIGRTEKWFTAELRGAAIVRVPGVIQEIFPAYHGIAWYARSFDAPSNPNPRGRYLLRFHAVDYLADVWLNGTHVGRHEGGETPFTLDVTDAIRPNVGNRLTVRVLNPTNEPVDGYVLRETPRLCKIIPFFNGNLYDFGGIIDSVELLMAPAVRIEDLYLRPDWRTGTIRIQVSLLNTDSQPLSGKVEFGAASTAAGSALAARATFGHPLPAGASLIETELQIPNHELWDLDRPCLYRVTARVRATEIDAVDESSVCCGFRDLRVEKGYFRLNGRRIFLRSTVTLGHCPIGQRLPPPKASDLLRRDMLYSKMAGFNIVRIVGMPYPYQLNLCDELGLMVHESSYASWKLNDSPYMKERYDRSTREMVLRDRNHPCVAIWEMLNETDDGPIFRHAVSTLPLVRSLDDTRLVMLSSGRFDCDPSIGSVSNPGSSEWEHVWGVEAPGAPPLPKWNVVGYPSTMGSGDMHIYPQVPETPAVNQLLRTIGQNTKPIYISEYGTGSQIDAIHEARRYREMGADPDLEDYVLMRDMAAKVEMDWTRYGLDAAYAFPQDLLRDSQRVMAHYRRVNFDLIRSNPKLCGFSVTGMVDEGMTGGGLWRFWRDWKPQAMDAIADGWAPLRWCLFTEPSHLYAGEKLVVEAVLANEDVLAPGSYPAQFRVCGDKGIIWDRKVLAQVPAAPDGSDGPLAFLVLREEIFLDTPAGTYHIAAKLDSGGAPAGRSLNFYISDRSALVTLRHHVTLWGIDSKAEQWLNGRGLTTKNFLEGPSRQREIILVGDLSANNSANRSNKGSDLNSWQDLIRRMARGGMVVFLSPSAFQLGKDPVAWLPLSPKSRYFRFDDVSIYHKECVAKPHSLFEGLPSKGIMDWDYYGPVIPHYAFDGLAVPDDVAAIGFAVGFYGAYASGVLLGSYRCSVRNDSFTPMGSGGFILNTFPILENLNAHPAADRLLLNLIQYASRFTSDPLAPLPGDYDAQFRKIGYQSTARPQEQSVMGAAGPEQPKQ